MISLNSKSLSVAVGLLTLVGSAVNQANAQTLSISINGGEQTEYVLEGPPPNGIQTAVHKFEGGTTIENSEISWGLRLTHNSPYTATPTRLTIDKSPTSPVGLTIKNLDADTQDYSINISMPVLVPFKVLEVDGLQTFILTTNADGGSITCIPGSQLTTVSSDLGANTVLKYCPFNMGSSGSGTAQTMNIIGANAVFIPGNGVPVAGQTLANIVFTYNFRLTSGDKIFFDPTFILYAQPICVGDQDMSFSVSGSDLSAILGKWGTGDMVGDLSVDGFVGSPDIISSLGYFGSVCETPASPPQSPAQEGPSNNPAPPANGGESVEAAPPTETAPVDAVANVTDNQVQAPQAPVAAVVPSKAANAALKGCSKKVREQAKAAVKRANRKGTRAPAMRLAQAKAMVRCLAK